MAKDFADINRLEDEAGLQAANTVSTADAKQDITSRFVAMWEKKNAQRALRGGAVSTMALTLAACGGDDDDNNGNVDNDNEINVTPIASDLTANSDSVDARGGDDTIVAGLVQNPAGSDRVNSLQDEDVIDGGTGLDTLDITLGNPNDNGAQLIAPTVSAVETIDVEFAAQVAMRLDLQDTDAALATLNVTKIGTDQADDGYGTATPGTGTAVINIPETSTALSLADSVFYSDHAFGFRDDEIDGDETVSILLGDVNLETLAVGATNNQTNHINTFDVTVDVASHIETMSLLGGSAETATQTVNITADADFILAADGDADPVSQGNGDYLDDNQAWSEFDHLQTVSVVGAGDVTLGAVGTAAGFALEGAAATGDIGVNIANSIGDAAASFATGSGDDRVTNVAGPEADMASTLATNAGSDSVELGGTQLFDTAEITTGAGVDTVAADVLHGTVAGGASIDTGSEDDTVTFNWTDAIWDDAPTVDNDDQNPVIEAFVEEEAAVVTGTGDDQVDFSVNDINLDASVEDGEVVVDEDGEVVFDGPEAVRVVVEGDSDNSDVGDAAGGVVDLGAGDDTVGFSFLGTGLADMGSPGTAGGEAMIMGNVDGGAGDDAMTVSGNKDIRVVESNTADGGVAALETGQVPADVAGDEDVAGFGVEGVETLNLVSVAGYDGARHNQIDGFSDEPDVGTGDALPDIVDANDDDGETSDYWVDLNEFNADLATVNITHLDGVVDNRNVEDTFENAFDGDDATYHLAGIVDEQINVVGFETTAVESTLNVANTVDGDDAIGDATGDATNNADDRAVLDPFGNIYDAGTFSADVTLNVAADDPNSTLNLDLMDATPEDISAAGVENYDVKIDSNAGAGQDNAANNGWADDHDYASLDLAVSSDDQLSIDLSNDFETALTVTGDAGETGGWANIINVDAAAIDTSGYEGRVYIGYEGTAGSHSVIAGSNDDVVRLGDDGQITTNNVTSTVSMGAGNDVLVMNFDGSTVGLGAADQLDGNAGDDVLGFGGTGAGLQMYDGFTDQTKDVEVERVRHDEAEYDDVDNFETFWYGVGTGNNNAVTHDVVNGASGALDGDTAKQADADEYGNPAVYPAGGTVTNGVETFDTDLHQPDAPASDPRFIINDQNNAAGYDVELSNDVIARNASVDERYEPNGGQEHFLLNVVNDDHGGTDADFALEITELDRYHNVNFQGADAHDRVIFSDGSLDGRDVLDGGDQGSDEPDGNDSSNSGDTIEVRNDANITANDLQGISGFEILELSSDQSSDQQFTVTLDDSVDGDLDYIFMVGGEDAVYSAGSTFGEVAGTGVARLDLDASQSSDDLTVDAQFGGVANDDIVTGDGDDTVMAGDGNDTIDGGAGDDVIEGGDGDDVISGGAGDDQLTGGAGADTFVFDPSVAGTDTITDYNVTEDTIRIEGIGGTNAAEDDFAGAIGTLTFSGGDSSNTTPWDAEITFTGGGTLVLEDLFTSGGIQGGLEAIFGSGEVDETPSGSGIWEVDGADVAGSEIQNLLGSTISEDNGDILVAPAPAV